MRIDPTSDWPEFCRRLYDAALAAVDPATCVPTGLPDPSRFRAVKLVAAGKAAASMAAAVEQAWPDVKLEGIAVCPYGYGVSLKKLSLMEAAHPVPDENSVLAAGDALEIARGCRADELFLFLVSGGASSLLCAPAAGITLADKQRLTQSLLRCGASIDEMNCVRQHLSLIKGGGLAQAASHAGRLLTLAISDVVGDKPSVIASGPTVRPMGSLDEAKSILERYGIQVPAFLDTFRDGAHVPLRGAYKVVGSAGHALTAAEEFAVDNGLAVERIGDALEGEAREVAHRHAALVEKKIKAGVAQPVVLISGGELTVTVKGAGQGGPNQEYVLALANHLRDQRNWCAFAADTDGRDGSGGAAGAYVSSNDLTASDNHGFILDCLQRNDSFRYFSELGRAFNVQPTKNNVNDLRAILLIPANHTRLTNM